MWEGRSYCGYQCGAYVLKRASVGQASEVIAYILDQSFRDYQVPSNVGGPSATHSGGLSTTIIQGKSLLVP